MRTSLAALAFAISVSLSSGTLAAAADHAEPTDEVLSVVCGPKANVLTWKLLEKRNSNSVLRSVDGGTNEWVCGGPKGIAPCTNLNVNVFIDSHVVQGQIYRYKQKSAPACASNTVTCPSGISTGKSCLTGGVTVHAPAPGGSPNHTPPADGDVHCTGGNPKCICVKEAPAYGRYESAASAAVLAAYPGLSAKPSDLSDGAATAAICKAYNTHKTLGKGTECRPQGDEIVLEDPKAPDPRYTTISVDVITSAGAFWAKSIAACALGVQ